MLAAYQLALEEADETEGDVIMLSEYLEKFGFDKLRGHENFQDVLNSRGKKGSKLFRRV